jgi:hypothetical protein
MIISKNYNSKKNLKDIQEGKLEQLYMLHAVLSSSLFSDFYRYFKDMNFNDNEDGVRFNVDSERNNVHIDDYVLDVYTNEN